jgi:ABC-type Fe3+/spermidine/putrescine transport system ATPase subunit
MLEVRGLAKSWSDFRLELGFSLERGEIAALLGPSGSGKSTLLRILAGLEIPDEGGIIVAGRDVTSLPPERRGIGMVFQDYALFPHLSVRRNIEYGPRMRGIGRARRRREAEAVAASFEIDRLLDRSPLSLSGGERQRVALARAMASHPSILLLDEPLSSLDAALRLRLRDEIARRLKESGMTALIVTHDAKEALAVADRVFLMRSGSIDSEGTPEALYESPPTAWSAAFLGRGPVLDVRSLSRREGLTVACTDIGEFSFANPSHAPSGSGELSLFFPSSSPKLASLRRTGEAFDSSGGASVMRNRITGRVLAASFEGDTRRISMACRVVPDARPDGIGERIVELEIPARERPAIGEILEFSVEAGDCLLIPGRLR